VVFPIAHPSPHIMSGAMSPLTPHVLISFTETT